MNRTVLGWSTLGVALALTVPVTAVSAQVPFKVSRPQDGAQVREVVRIRMARTALQQNGVKYLSLSVDGKFRAGIAVPEVQYEKDGRKVKPLKTELVESDDQMVSILWNTKALTPDPENPGMLEGVKDGPHTIDIIAFDALNKRVGKESLTLTVANQGGLRAPADGILLAYRFQVGEEVNYRQKTDVEFLGERKAAPPAPTGGNGFASQGRGQGFAGGGGGNSGMMMGGPGGMPGGMMGGGSSGGGRFGGPGGMPGGSSGGRRFGGPGGMPGGSGGSGGMMMGGPGGMPGGGSSGMGGRMGGGQGMRFGGPGGMPGGPMGGFGGAAGGAAFDATGPFTLPVQSVRANYVRSTEDRSSAEAYFIRDLVKDGTIVSGNGASARLQDVYNFKSRYRTVATSGAVLDPGIANAAHPGAYVALPVIDLGGGRRRIGTTWSSLTPCFLEWATLDSPPLVRAINTLEGLEWQDNNPTARIKQTFEGRANIPIYGGMGEIKGAKVKMDRVIWFGFKVGRIIKMETTIEVEGDAPADVLGAMVPAAGVGGGGGMMGGGMGRFGSGSGMMMGSGDGPTMGGGGSGFGGMQGDPTTETVTAPAKFKSTTVINYVPKVAPARTAARTLPKPKG